MIGDRWYPSHLTELSTEECYALLASRPVGRIAFVVDDAPIVLPVNHAVDGDDIIFRTSPRTELGRRMIRGQVAFEVDDFDEFNQSGWSVLFQGSVEVLMTCRIPSRTPAARAPDRPGPPRSSR